MGKFKLDEAGIRKIRDMLETQVRNVNRLAATEAYEYLIDFGYHAIWDSGERDDDPGWSFYTAANWNCSINVADKSYLVPERKITDGGEDYGSRESSIDLNKARTVFESVKVGDSLFVTNTSPYIKVLNDGGESKDLYLKRSRPNHFMELAEAHIKDVAEEIIKITEKGCPNL